MHLEAYATILLDLSIFTVPNILPHGMKSDKGLASLSAIVKQTDIL